MKDCIDAILDFYSKHKSKENNKENMWIGSYLINLMNNFEKDLPDTERQYLEVRNCLILLINLLLGIKFPDHYHTRGKSVKDLNVVEKHQFFDLLRTEINNELLN